MGSIKIFYNKSEFVDTKVDDSIADPYKVKVLCPFCGSTICMFDERNVAYQFKCLNCGFSFPISYSARDALAYVSFFGMIFSEHMYKEDMKRMLKETKPRTKYISLENKKS